MTHDVDSPTLNSGMHETVAVPDELRAEVLAEALGTDGDIYSDSFAARGVFIKGVAPIAELFMRAGTVTGAALGRLANGETVSLTLTDMPTDPELPDAPPDGGRPVGKKTFVSEAAAIGLARALGGYPGIILGEKREAVVHQITPVVGREKTQSNEGSTELLFHQDLAPNHELPNMGYHEAMATWLMLSGLRRGSGNTPTYIAAVDDALELLPESAIEALRQPRFITNPPDSFVKENPDIADHLPAHPILLDYKGNVEASFDTSSNVRPQPGEGEAEALRAINELNIAFRAVRRELVIEPGTAVLFNNRRVVHGRGAVGQESAPDPASSKRWLQRIYIFEPERFATLAIANSLVLQGGGGVVRLAPTGGEPNRRLLELSNAA